jgi:hypothetical protein
MIAYYKRFLFLIYFLGSIGVALAQFPPGGPPIDEEQIPLDGGISLLAGAGILYGIKSIHSKNKTKA